MILGMHTGDDISISTAIRVGVDVGGTFTDLAAVVGDRLYTAKVPSTPHDQSEAVAAAIRASGLYGPLLLAHGMTVATNALLERRGARTALVTTEGFRDLIEIARQTRADLYDLAARRPAPLVPRELRFTVHERVGPHGIITPLDRESVAACVAALAPASVEAVAVCLLFSFRDPSHERALGEAIRAALPGVHVSLSSEVLPEFREYERLTTTVADAFLAPEMTRYLSRLMERVAPLGVVETRVMQSTGGVASIMEAARLPASCVLSGPAGGVVGASAVARELRYHDVLTMDIGGTSTDVAAIVGGAVVTSSERSVAGVEIRLPMLDIHTIGAGGGSIVWVDAGGGLRIGPRSAGAVPGPASYGLGGSAPTVSDANLLLGYLRDGMLLGGHVRLNRALAEQALEMIGRPLDMSPLEVAAGVARVTAVAIAQALRELTVERGLDPRGFALLAFGGAGALHACAVADELGITTVLVPSAAGVLSALGLAISDLRADAVRSVLLPADQAGNATLEAPFAELERDLAYRLPGARLSRRADLRYRRQAHELTVAADSLDALTARFHQAHEQRYGYAMEHEPVQVVSIRVTGTIAQPRSALPAVAVDDVMPESSRPAWFNGVTTMTPVTGALRSSEPHEGPLIVELPGSTCVVPPGWTARAASGGTLILERRP